MPAPRTGRSSRTAPPCRPHGWSDLPAGVDADQRGVGRDRRRRRLHAPRARAGHPVRLTDLEGDACAHVLLFNADEPWERLNVADTVKVPWQAYLGAGHPLLSRSGPGARHDRRATRPGATTRSAAPRRRPRNAERYGDGAPQGPSPPAASSSSWRRQARAGPPRRPAGVSFFQGVRVDADGAPATSRAPPARARRSSSGRAAADRADRQRAAPARPARGLRRRPAGASPGAARRPTPDDPSGSARPSASARS